MGVFWGIFWAFLVFDGFSWGFSRFISGGGDFGSKSWLSRLSSLAGVIFWAASLGWVHVWG